MSIMFCSKCHWESPSGSNFCFQDGTKMVPVDQKVICPCSAILDECDKFCTNCGKQKNQEPYEDHGHDEAVEQSLTDTL